MTSKSSRLGRPSSAGSKQPSHRKDCPVGNRSCMLRVGERLMRAGSEGNLHVVRPKPAQQTPLEEGHQHYGSITAKDLGNNNQRLSSPEDVGRFHRQQTVENQNHHSEPRSPCTVPRRYTAGGQGSRSARDSLTMQHADVERRKEVFLEHLKQRYPHHAAVIMGHQDHLRDHARSPPPGIGEQREHLSVASLESLETMSEGDGLAAFNRGCQARASLPVVRSSNQTRDRSLGVLNLQYAEETKQIRMPNEITSRDTVRALFVSAFPQQLTMKMLESPSVAVCIKDDTRNMYYELTDVRNITPRCCLKVYHKDPAHAFNRSKARPINAEGRIPREILYGSHSPVHTLKSTCSPVHAIQGSMSPPMVRSMPSSPSRIPYSPRAGRGVPGSATLPRAGMSSGPPIRSVTTCPSAILERRDVKPDEDLSSKSMALLRADGLHVNVTDPYAVQEGRLSIASSQGGGQTGDMVDIGGGSLHRASVKSTASYTENSEQQHSLYRQKSRRYGESQGLPLLGTKTPPSSPHRLNDIHGPVALERGSPICRSLRKESNGNTVEVVNRTRGSVSSVSSSPVFVELPPGYYGDRLFQGHLTPDDPQTSERMKAMEQQIASLAGLVQHALAIGPAEIDRRTASPFHVNNSAGGSPVPAARSPALLANGSNALVSQAPPPDPTLQVTLTTVRRNVTDLRQQLHQLRQLQMQNQDSVRGMLKRAEEELAEVMSESLQRQQLETEPGQRQRTTVDEERHKYQAMEERVLVQLMDLEEYVDRLRRDSSSSKGQLSITLRDVEEGAVNLRRVGEALAGLKGEFPSLHGKMRTVLRVEVEALRFLKEEPHKMDSMLKRVKALTEALSGLRRCVTENHPHDPEPGAATAEGGVKPAIAQSEPPRKNLPTIESPKPQTRPSVRHPQPQVKSPAGRPDTAPTSPDIVQRVKSSPVNIQPCQHSAALPHHPSPPLTPTHCRDSPTVAKVSPRSRENSPALQKRIVHWCGDGPAPTASSTETTTQLPGSEEIHTNSGIIKHIVMDIEVAESEKDLEEGRSPQKSAATSAGSEFEQILQEAQASLMRAIPDLEVTGTGRRVAQSSPPHLAPDHPSLPQPLPDPELPLNIPLPDEVDAPKPTEASLPEPTQPANVAAEVTVQASPERPHRPMDEKPHRPSVEREMKNSPEKAGKSPPPPPPRKFFPSLSGPGLTTGRSGEVIFTTRKEAAPAQDDEEEVFPQPSPKPTRQPPEVKPKLETTPVSTASAEPEEKEDEEEDDDEEEDKFMKELQVFQKCTLRDVSTNCVIDLTSTASQVRQIEPELSLSPKDPKSQENKGKQKGVLNTDENRFEIVPKSPRVMYYITGQLSNEKLPSGKTDQSEGREGTVSPSQVANTNTFDSQQPELLIADTLPLVSCNSVLESQDCPPNTQKIAVGEDSEKKSLVDENVRKDPVLSQKVGVVKPVSPPIPAEKQDISEPSQQDCYLTNSIPSSSSSSSPPPSSPASPPLSSSSPPPVPVIQSMSSTGLEVSGNLGSPPPESRGLDDSQSQQVVLRSSRGRPPRYVEEGSSLSPDLPDEEGPPPPENISFMMISSNRVQALSTGEYQEIVNGTNVPEVHNVNVGNDTTRISQEHSGFDKKPVIIVFNEPIDIQSAYKRMSTIFECEEELDRLLHQESIKEEAEEAGSEKSVPQATPNTDLHQANKTAVTENTASGHNNTRAVVAQQKSTAECSLPEQSKAETSNSSKPETKKMFKFKFPKNKLAAISQAIRTGTKTGKKTLQVVEWDGHIKENKRFEINSSSIPQTDSSHLTAVNNITSPSLLTRSNSKRRTEEICKNAYESITSLEETIKQLEITVDNISPAEPKTDSCEDSPATVKPKREREGSPSKRPAPPQVSKSLKHPQSKKSKPQLPRPSITSSSKKQNTSGSPSSSRMSLSLSAKSWQQPAGSDDKPGGKTQKLQANQKQFSQANRSAKKAGGDSSRYFLALPASKIPAFCHSFGKNMSLPGPNSLSNPIKSPSSSPSSSFIPSLNLSRLIPPSPSLNDRRQNLTLSSQTQNGRPSPFSYCSSSSSTSPSSNSSSLSPTSTSSTSSTSSSSPPSPSLLSPTAMSQGARSIHRNAHIPSFTVHKMQGGHSSKTTHTPAASSSKDI